MDEDWPFSHVIDNIRQIIGIKIKKKVGEWNPEQEISKKFRHRMISCFVTCNEYSCLFSFLSTCFTMQCSIHRFLYLFIQCFKDFILPILPFFQTNYIYEWFHAVILCYWLNIYGGFLNINVFMLFYETNSFSNLKIFQIYSTIKFWNWIIILFPS